MTPDKVVRCCDGCGATVPEREVEGSGWEYLPIQLRYRCVDCWRALKEVNRTDEVAA